jgi:rod shape-determining protein MreC
VVLTSGLGGRFPKGIPIGQVVEVRQRDIDVVQQAVVRPQVNFNQLELVAVVTNFDPNEEIPAMLAGEAPPADIGAAVPLTATDTLTDTLPLPADEPLPVENEPTQATP